MSLVVVLVPVTVKSFVAKGLLSGAIFSALIFPLPLAYVIDIFPVLLTMVDVVSAPEIFATKYAYDTPIITISNNAIDDIIIIFLLLLSINISYLFIILIISFFN